MTSAKSLFRVAGVLTVLAMTSLGASAQDVTKTETKTTITQAPSTLSRGLFQIKDTSTFFWLDEFGVRHYVKNPEVARTTYFTKEPVVTVTKQELRTYPLGQSITVQRGPDTFVKERDATAIMLEKPRMVMEYGSGPSIRRVEVRNYSSLKNVTTADDLEDLEDLYED